MTENQVKGKLKEGAGDVDSAIPILRQELER